MADAQILVAIVTRNRPTQLACLIRALDGLAAKPERILYAVRPDDDDRETWRTCMFLGRDGLNLVFCHGRPYIGLGGKRDQTVHIGAQGMPDWDVVFHASDDVIPITKDWDIIVDAASKKYPCFAWNELNDPDNTAHWFMTRPWYDTISRPLPDFFAFWFDDTWVKEVHTLAFGEYPIIIDNLILAGKRGHTQGMRELSFWFDVFAKTRPIRLLEAKLIAKAYGREMPSSEPLIAKMEENDAWQLSRVSLYEERFGSTNSDPPIRYLAARAAAKNAMARATSL